MTTSTVASEPWAVAVGHDAALKANDAEVIGRPFRRIRGLLIDAALLLALVCVLPLTVLVVGSPLALLLRLLLELVKKL